MADLSFSFHWSQASSAVVLALAASSVASAASNTASAASVAAASASNAASAASVAAASVSSAASNALSKATDASSAVVTLDGTAIKSIPGTDSRAVHEIMVTSAGLIKYVYSSVAQV